jgi:hypothetical protein
MQNDKLKCKNKGVKRISPVEVLYKHINSWIHRIGGLEQENS